jgi:hypothetical protein
VSDAARRRGRAEDFEVFFVEMELNLLRVRWPNLDLEIREDRVAAE